MDVSENSGTPKSSILRGFSIITHPFWGTPIFGNTHMDIASFPKPYQNKDVQLIEAVPLWWAHDLEPRNRPFLFKGK